MMSGAIRRAALLGLLLLAPISAHAADPIPDYILNNDYNNCMKGSTQDPDAAKHCDCLRTKMRQQWTLDDYGDMIMEQLKDRSHVPAKTQALVKACLEETQPKP